MHQSFKSKNKNFSLGDIVCLDNGMPDFEDMVGFGVIVAMGPTGPLMDNEVMVHWQNNVWTTGREQKMSSYEIRHVILL
tara:strand:- start:760 stop:996 length:237 start_codon:yes stop_codon:yes gene_type:complete